MSSTISINNPVASEGDGYIEFVVTLNEPSALQVSVYYSTGNETASYSDFNSTYGTLVFAPGVTSQTVRVSIINDNTVEALETFKLNLSTPVNATIGQPSGTALIVDNDAIADSLHPANLSVRDVVVDETASTVSFVVTLDRAVSDNFNVTYTTTNGTAEAGSDYSGADGVLNFAPGETAKTITVNINNDSNVESDEFFTLNLGVVSGKAAGLVQVADGIGQALIGHNDMPSLAAPVISVSNSVVGEGDGYVEFVVSLNAPGNSPVTVHYSTGSETASYNDFESTSGNLTFAPGVTTQTVRVSIINDLTVESIETFKLFLSAPVNGTIGQPAGTATIIDNDNIADSVHPANLTVRDVVVDEAAGTASFVVTLDRAVSDSFSVTYATANGSALSANDYTAVVGNLSFAPGETAKTVTVNIINDTIPETDEFFTLNLGTVTGKAAGLVQIADGTGQALIGRNDMAPVAAPVISVGNAVASENDGYVEFVVSLNAPGTSQISVYYSTGNETASYNDFNSTYGTLIFAPGVTTQTVRVSIINDSTVEALETFKLNLSTPVNATIGQPSGTALIVDNDAIADSLQPANLSVRDVVVDESAGIASFVVTLDRAVNDSFSVSYSTVNGSAVGGSDYTTIAGKLSFAPGETVKTVLVNINDDTSAELEEFFTLNLGVVSGKGAGIVQIADGIGQAMIGRSDLTPTAAPVISVSNSVVGEGDGYVEFVVSLNAPGNSPVTVHYSTGSETASYNDFESTSGNLTFAPGVTTQTVRVSIINDLTVESLETFKLFLSAPVNGTIGQPAGTATIIDNDGIADSVNPANVSLQDLIINENAGTASFAITLSKATSSSFSFSYATVDGTATAGADYLATSGKLSFAPGETVKYITVSLINDPWVESNETFRLELSALSGAAANTVVFGKASATATITSDDVAAPNATYSLTSSTPTVSEGNSVTFNLASTGVPSGSQLAYNLTGIDANRIVEPLQGFFTLDALGNASIKVNLLDNASIDQPSTLKISLLNTPNTAQVSAIDAIPLAGTNSNDLLRGTNLNDKIDGGAGRDLLIYNSVSSNFSISKTATSFVITDNVGSNGIDTLSNVERIQFTDISVAFDIAGNAGQIYRLYQAAFDRKPDLAGLGYWIDDLDNHGSSLTTVAAGFFSSPEFQSLYGVKPNVTTLITNFYANVLHRAPDQAGFDYWANELNAGKITPAGALASFSESTENQAQVIAAIETGINYLVWLG